jgi:hypothetical protein
VAKLHDILFLFSDQHSRSVSHLRGLHPELRGTVFHSTRKWFITQFEPTGVPEYFTASLVGHHLARSANKLTYGLYSAGISDGQKRVIVEGSEVTRAVRINTVDVSRSTRPMSPSEVWGG